MGWKSTKDLSRSEAISLIEEAKAKRTSEYEEMTNEQLEELLYHYEYGDDTDLPYYGCNFSVGDPEEWSLDQNCD